MKLVKYVVEGEPFPNWYGCAWRDFAMRRTVCYPIPLNLILNVFRRLWHWSLLSLRLKHSVLDKAFQEGIQEGIKMERATSSRLIEQSYDRGADDGMKEVYRRIEKRLDD